MSAAATNMHRMDVILVPGFWLDASSWDEVAVVLRSAGHTAHPVTLPGLDPDDGHDPREVTLRGQVDAVIDLVDSLGDRVVLVGHSGGGAVIHAVADARPASIERAVYVDTAPLAHGSVINDELPVVEGVIPLPGWDVFDAPDLIGLDEELRESFRARAMPQPARVASDRQVLSDERRFSVPVTIIACEFTADDMKGWVASGYAPFAELDRISSVEYRELPTGHWPQFTRPFYLGETILAAIARR